MKINAKNLPMRLAVIVVSCLLVVALFIGYSQPVSAADDSYTTNEFNVKVVAHENNSFDVQENILVDFYYPHHGIYRYVPTNGTRITNIRVPNYEYDVYTEGGNVVLQIGSGDYTLVGPNEYNIGYKMTAYDDREKELDRLMLNIIPTGWQTPIEHATATIELPKKADLSDIQLYSGPAWSEENSANAKAVGSADGKTITVTADYLAAGDGITVILELPEGYWVGERELGGIPVSAVFLLLLGPIAAAVLWFLFGRDKHMVKTIEFYPPNKLTPGEIGYIIDNSADKCDIVSSIVYLANKGYITIEEYGDHDYKLTRVKDISNEPAYIKDIYDGLFAGGNEVINSELGTDFGRKYEEAKEDLVARFAGTKKAIYSPTSMVIRVVITLLTALPCMAYSVWQAYSGNDVGFFMNSVFAIFGTYLICNAFDKIHSAKKSRTLLKVLGGLIAFEVGIVAAVQGSELLMQIGGSRAMAIRLSVIIAEAIIVFFAVISLARKKEYTELMGKILGFRDFIRTAELDKLKTLVEETPSYFYDIMPYAYVFGLSDKWIKNFEDIKLPQPEWYAGTQFTYFDGYLMGRMMSNCSAGVSNHIRVPIDVSSSGISGSDWLSGGGSGGGFIGGGGGFSGGGFGGGGGGAW